MANLGKYNKLQVKSRAVYGFMLDGEELGDILLPNKEVKVDLDIGDTVEVFVYVDSDEKLFATTKKPKAQIDEFACLPVVSISRVGAFLDLGLSKDVLVRFAEQKVPMQEGRSYFVYVYLENDGTRMAASSRIDHFLNPDIGHYEPGSQVNVTVWEETDLGYKVIIDNKDPGLLYKTEVFQPLSIGQKLQAFIKNIREDLKVDLILQKPGYQKPDVLAHKIMKKLTAEQGFLAINDKSSSELISKMFGVSKKKFKMALGGLYRQRVISIDKDGIRLTKI